MLLYHSNNINRFNQLSYENDFKHIHLDDVSCPKCGSVHSLTFYGTYPRSLYSENGMIRFRAKRCICSQCGSTHSILPSFFIPYSRISLMDACSIIEAGDKKEIEDTIIRLSISMDLVRKIRNIFFLYWSKLFPNFYDSSFSHITHFCVSSFCLQFLQIRFLYLNLLPT